MRFSFVKILLIVFFAIAVALLINYLQPEGLPLFNENKTSHIDENLNTQSPTNNYSQVGSNDSIKHDFNKIAVEKNRVQINEDLLPEYHYKNDSDLAGNNENVPTDISVKNDDGINLSNLTTDVFNQPRLISLNQAYELYRDKILFVDARNPEEFEEGHIVGAINIPYFTIDRYSERLAVIDKTEPLVTYCEGADCDMSIRLGNELFSKGFRKVFVFFGGWEEWSRANYPVVTSNPNFHLN